jgi:FtsP/CotA-like multicopper oxidase with cupredoxin domain
MPTGSFLAGLVLFTAANAASGPLTLALPDHEGAGHVHVLPNDNRRPAGSIDNGRLTLSLRAGQGSWQPEGAGGPALTIEALGETSASLMVPSPLIRAREGTVIAVSIRNELDATLVVHGLCARDGAACVPLDVPAGEVRQVEFKSGPAGTYHYWASTIGAPVPFRELAGAFVVDPPDGKTVDDRVFVITEWSSLTPPQLRTVLASDDPSKTFASMRPQATFMINGLSWPATERLTYELGEVARWRVINLSSQAHPMHLHGFYFEVNSLGDGTRDEPIAPADRHPVVTQVLQSGTTMSLTWTPERVGNWLFHCHIMHHISAERRLPSNSPTPAHEHSGNDSSAGMAGMILGVTVLDRKHVAPTDDVKPMPRPRKLTLVMAKRSANGEPAFGFKLIEDGIGAGSDAATAPGPTLVLRRNEPVEITVVNQLGESTALHWHGMELDSYYDGVHNWSGIDKRVAPMIEPDQSFVVRFTPPRSGTFMYHTHLHDERQLPLGLYGPMVVVDPEQPYDPATDHVVLVGRSGLDPAAPNVIVPATPVVINGERAPVFVWKAGTRHRVRLINITPDDIVSVALQSTRAQLQWTPVTKDGAPLPASARVSIPARQTVAVGETYDFQVDVPPGRQTLWLEVRSTAGKWEAQGRIVAR